MAVTAPAAAAAVPAAGPGDRPGDGGPGPEAAAVEGPLPGSPPGDPDSPDIEDTYPWLATHVDLAAAGYVEEEFIVEGEADAYSLTGERLATDVPYRTRILVRRPTNPHRFNGAVLAEWQNVSAGFDIDALWAYRHILRAGYAWVGISAQRVGVDHLKSWSPARYGDLDVTGGGRFTADELSYDIFAQAAAALRASARRGEARPLGRLRADTLLAIGGSQSAGRMTVYYDQVLPQVEPVFDGYGFIVGSAPSRDGDEPVFHLLSETDVRSPNRRPDSDRYRRWEVAGAAHSGWNGQEYRRPLLERDLGAAPEYECDQPPFSRVPLHQVLGAAFDHLVRWVERGTPPPTAPPLELAPDGSKVRDELGLARGGIRLSQVEVPIALNTGDNAGETFCGLFGTHVPFDEELLDELYPSRGRYVAAVARVDHRNVRAGYITAADARDNRREALESGVGR
ncbi:MAG TPA: alpha/beta hydrolase domain-containing protein [Acidimicrobiales bacterium]